jgi:hypothetical protein
MTEMGIGSILVNHCRVKNTHPSALGFTVTVAGFTIGVNFLQNTRATGIGLNLNYAKLTFKNECLD